MTPFRAARAPRASHIAMGALLLAALPGAAGCSTSHADTSHDATVYGKVLNGGPHRVTVIAGRILADKKLRNFHTLTSTAGTFSITVPPGAYILTSPPCGRVMLRLRPGDKVKQNFNCIVG
jgi:hypothetical protein